MAVAQSAQLSSLALLVVQGAPRRGRQAGVTPASCYRHQWDTQPRKFGGKYTSMNSFNIFFLSQFHSMIKKSMNFLFRCCNVNSIKYIFYLLRCLRASSRAAPAARGLFPVGVASERASLYFRAIM